MVALSKRGREEEDSGEKGASSSATNREGGWRCCQWNWERRRGAVRDLSVAWSLGSSGDGALGCMRDSVSGIEGTLERFDLCLNIYSVCLRCLFPSEFLVLGQGKTNPLSRRTITTTRPQPPPLYNSPSVGIITQGNITRSIADHHCSLLSRGQNSIYILSASRVRDIRAPIRTVCTVASASLIYLFCILKYKL